VEGQVNGRPTPIPNVNRVGERNRLAHIRVPAGFLPDGPSSQIDASPLSERRYLFAVGDTGVGVYSARSAITAPDAIGDFGRTSIRRDKLDRFCLQWRVGEVDADDAGSGEEVQ
jgi:hypothetical protein